MDVSAIFSTVFLIGGIVAILTAIMLIRRFDFKVETAVMAGVILLFLAIQMGNFIVSQVDPGWKITEEAPVCLACGEKVGEYDNFCGKCGEPVGSDVKNG